MKFRNQFLPIAIILFYISAVTIYAQDVKEFSLREAQIYALEHNYDVINALTDIEIAKKKVKETIATGLPQISGQISYNDYLEIPTQLIPGEFFQSPNEFEEIKFGTQHNATWSAGINQMIFNGQYLVGLQASQAYLSLSETSYEKTEIEIKDVIAKAYYPVIILQENKVVFDSTLSSMEKMLYETREYYKAGFIEDTDVDQLELLISDMRTTIANIDNQMQIARNTFKYLMGIKANEEIRITDNLDQLIAEVDREFLLNSPFDHNSHIDYKILKNQEAIAYLNLKLNRSEYYPMINAFYNYSENAMRNKFDFFTSGSKWYPTQILGFQMDIPIFSSGYRKYKVQQAKLEIEKIKVQEDQLKQGLSLKVRTAKSEFSNSYLIYRNKELALTNSERIYQKTEIKYREGISTSLELSQTYNQYLTAQIDFLSATLDLLSKKSELEKELTKVNF
ncbi:MAG: TolC family protein [Bacteroidales bacterium]|nr:TolC family protein [Bacteroidales bacterium]MCF8403625.1 TolC family protein [Bacteroidales bacterium]